MRTQDIYDRLDILPTLQLHMLRVAAVAHILCERLTQHPSLRHNGAPTLPTREIVSACLVHDVGNLIKFDLDHIPSGLDLGGEDAVKHWKQVQRTMRETYGTDEHMAHERIIQSLGLSPLTQYIAKNVGTAHAEEMFTSKNVPVLLATYADFRITPTAVVPLQERINDLLHRYAGTPKGESYRHTTVAYQHIETWFHEHFSLDITIDPAAVEAMLPHMREAEVV